MQNDALRGLETRNTPDISHPKGGTAPDARPQCPAVLKFIQAIALGFVCLAIFAPSAEARRGIGIVNTGENVAHIADVKEEVRAEVEAETASGVAVGMIYNRFGLFWLDIWRWDKRFVLYSGEQVWDVPEATLKEMAAGPLKKPFTMTVPPGLIILVILGIGFVLVSIFLKDDDDEEEMDNQGASMDTGGIPPANT